MTVGDAGDNVYRFPSARQTETSSYRRQSQFKTHDPERETKRETVVANEKQASREDRDAFVYCSETR